MPAAVPAIPPKPKIAAMIAITKNVNAHPNMINTSCRCPLPQLGIRLLKPVGQPTPTALAWGPHLLCDVSQMR